MKTKISLSIIFLLIFSVIIFGNSVAFGAGEGCCTTAVNTSLSTCQKNIAKSQCSNVTNGQFFIADDPGCTSKSAVSICKLGCCTKKQGECMTYYGSKECNDKGYTFISSDPSCTGNIAMIQCSKNNGYNDSSCEKKCTQDQECKLDIETGKYYCTSAGGGSGTGGTGGKGGTGGVTFSNPLKYDTVEGLAGNLLNTLRTIIVILSIIFIVLGGIFYILSAGSDKMMKAAKGSITASMIGLAIGIAAPSFLKEIYTILGGTGSGSGITSPTGLSLSQIALNFLNFLLAIVGILALIMFIIGGITFLTSAGDEDRYKTGKKIVTYAVIGIAVSLAALVIVKQIANLLK